MKRYWSIVLAVVVAAWLAAGWAGEAAGGSETPSSGVNPRADFWRGVREGAAGTTTSASAGHKVLIQNGGQNWRQIRNGPIAGIAPWILAAVVFAIGVFFAIVGRDRLEEPRSGVTIPRFSLFERILHWSTAALFILLALTGLSMLFGRAVLIPVFGLGTFAAYMQAGMLVHNFSGPLFFAGVLVEAVTWVKGNIPRKMDLVWFMNLGGMVGKRPRPHAGRVNGGEKAWFWFMLAAGLTSGITGVILDFPNFGQSRQAMQLAHIIHASTAILFLAAAFGHIYIGTIGAEGTFEGMWRGTVDTVWAKQHNDLWYEQKAKELHLETG
jgi:formate dehydrogenase subunit gamma